jgi:hypothetical protein
VLVENTRYNAVYILQVHILLAEASQKVALNPLLAGMFHGDDDGADADADVFSASQLGTCQYNVHKIVRLLTLSECAISVRA